jgi:sodium/potassium-transporting ATPase subunit alpha
MLLFILASNMAETLAVLSFVVLKMPLPIGLVLILVLSFGTDLLPAVSLAYEECEFDLMTRRPRKHH